MAFDTYNVACRENVPAANKRHFAIWNGSSTLMVVITAIKAVEASTAAVAGLKIAVASTRMTSIPTGGTALGWSAADTQQPAMAPEIIAMKEHTAGSVSPDFFGASALNPEETVSASNGFLYQSPLDMSRPVTLRQNEGIEVRQGALAGAGNVSFVATVYVLPVAPPL